MLLSLVHQRRRGAAGLAAALFALVASALLVARAHAYDETTVENPGWVAGTVKVDDDVAPKLLPITKHREGCGTEPQIGGIVADERRVRDVAVYLDKVPAGRPLPKEQVVLDQVGCGFSPRVFALTAGQPLLVRNSDAVLHNVSATLEGQTVFDLAMPIAKMELWKKPLAIGGDLIKDGRVRFWCRAGHEWMEAWAIVKEHPYVTVTDALGAFHLDDVPPGEYRLVFWHPVLGEHTQTIRVEGGEGVRVDLELPVPSDY